MQPLLRLRPIELSLFEQNMTPLSQNQLNKICAITGINPHFRIIQESTGDLKEAGVINTGTYVEEHTDDSGLVFLYLAAGKGVLELVEDSTKAPTQVNMNRHECLIFDDHVSHSWISLTKTCHLFIVPILSYNPSHSFFKKTNTYFKGFYQ